MDSLEFNKTFFPRNTDEMFKLAVMFTRHPPISLTTQEILFFSNHPIYLTYTEMYNEFRETTSHWILGLDKLKDETDWQFHRNKLLTRFKMTKRVNDEAIDQFFRNNNDIPVRFVFNTAIIWNNAVYLAENDKYKNEANKNTWKLWDTLVKYKEDNYDEIIGDKNSLKEFNKVVTYRKEDEFLNSQKASLTENNLIYIEKVRSDLSTIFFKENLKDELGNPSIISSIRKRLKL
jgi:hypothetical protein